MNYTQAEQQSILNLNQQGLSSRKIADALGISKSGVNYYLERARSAANNLEIPTPPKILLFDLESAATISAHFGRFKVNIGQDNVIKEGGWLLSSAYKYLGQEEIKSAIVTPKQAVECNDLKVVIDLWDAIEDSDIVVGHNSKGFDWPLFKARCIYHGLPAPKKVKVIDTLELVKEFKFNSNKLGSLAKQLDLQHKIETRGISLWIDCGNGCESSLREMQEYNIGDIATLEELYLKLRSYSTKHPNTALYYNDNAMRCNVCGSTNVAETGNLVYTNLSKFSEFACGDCDARFRGRESLTTKEKRSKLLMN